MLGMLSPSERGKIVLRPFTVMRFICHRLWNEIWLTSKAVLDSCAQALAITPIQFLNLASLVIFWVLSFFAATERAKARLWQNQFMSYGSKARTPRLLSQC